jgi:hypothetical protein
MYAQKVVDDEANPPELYTLVNLWIMGNQFLIPRLQNETLVALDQRRVALYRRVGCFSRIYENTTEGSPLRQYVVQQAVSSYKIGTDLERPEDYPRDMLCDMFNFMRKGDQTKWVKFSREELKQFFVEEERRSRRRIEVCQSHSTGNSGSS